MKKKGILLLLCLSLTSATLGFVACGETETPHEHTYDTTKWESDATKHWHAATCEHSTEKADVDGHVDENVDGTCDTCGYNGDHVHTFENVWQSDATGHWKKADCFHDVTSGVEAHTADEMGDCTVCGYHVSDPDVSTVAKALNFAKANVGKVENGSITLNGDYFGTITDYVYANGYLYTNTKQTQNTESAAYEESWYSTDAKGAIFAVKRNQEGVVTRMTEFSDNISEDNLKGYQFVSPVTSTIGDFYGLEDLIAGLYEVGETNLNKDFEQKVEKGKYSFSFGYFEDGELYVVEVDFTLSGEYYIDNANVKVTSYGSEFNWDTFESDTLYEVVPGATEDDADTYKVKEGAEGYVKANYTVAQNVQAVVENEYPAEEVLVSSYKLVDATSAEVSDTLTIEKGETVYLYLAEVAPETAIIGLTDVNATGEAVDAYEIFIGSEEDESGNWAIYVRSYTVGEHTVTLNVNGVAKTLTVTVVEAQPTALNVNGYEYGGTDWWGDAYYVPVSVASEITVYTGTTVILSAEANKGDNVSCTATVNGAAATLEGLNWQNPEAYEGGFVDALKLDTTTAGTYTVVFASAALETLTETITVNVVDRPDMSEVLSGKYIYQANGYNAWEVEFAPESDGATKGTMTIAQYVYELDEDEKEVLVKYDAKYAYAWTNEEGVESFETKLVNGYDFGAVVSVSEATDYKIEVNGNALVKETTAMVLAGTWSYDVFDYNVSYTDPADTYTLTFNEDGTGVYKATGVEYYFTYTIGAFNELEGNYPITIAADESATNVGETTAFGAGATVTFGKMFSMVTYTMDWTVLVDNGEKDEWENPINYQYSKPTVSAENGYVWPTELTVGDVVNVYNGQFEQGVKEIELLINADKAGTYTVIVCKWGETAPIATLDEYYFDMNGMKIVGALTFEVAEAERIVLTMGIVNAGFDFDVIVDFVEAETEEEGGSAATNGAAFTVTTDMNASANQGEYTYTMDADGNITIYNGTEVASFSETYALKYADGKLTVYSGTSNERELTKYSDTDTTVLAGSWNWVMNLGGEMTVFDFTFAQIVEPSTMTVTTDMQMTSNQGEYTWTIDDAGNVTVYSNGVEATNFTITFVDGTLTYNGSVMTKSSDTDTSVLAGTWTFGMFYEITFTGTGAGATVGGNQGGEGTETTGAFTGTYAATDDWGNEITVVVTDDSITFTPPGPAGQEIVWTYVLSGDSITLYSGGDEITNPLSGAMTVSNGVATAMSYNGTNYTLTKA